MMTPSDETNSKSPLEPRIQAHIGRQLRQLYDQMISEPVPDRFKALLDELEKRQSPGDTGKDES